jgi:hypothetical protein
MNPGRDTGIGSEKSTGQPGAYKPGILKTKEGYTMERTRIRKDGTMVKMGKNKKMPGWYLKHFTFNGLKWEMDSVKYYSTEYETANHFEKEV